MKLIDVRSAIAGAGLVALFFGLASMQSSGPLRPLQIEGIPTPQQMMRVTEGVPFTVPPGKLFVGTGLTSNDSQFSGGGIVSAVTVLFDGVPVLAGEVHNFDCSHGGARTLAPIPPGLVAAEGTVISADLDADSAGALGVLLGYLADA